MKTFHTAWWSLFGFVLSLSLSAQAQRATPAQPEHVKLQLKWVHKFQFAGFYAAVEKGYYRDAGLEVELLEGRSNADFVKEVSSGEVEYGVEMPDLLLRRKSGEPVVVLAAIFQSSPIALVSLVKANIKSPRDLVGRKVMLRSPGNVELRAMITHEGVALDKITIVGHSFNVADLAQGTVDAMSLYYANYAYDLKASNIAVNVMQPSDYGIDFYGDCLFTSENELRDHPARARAFRKASLLGWEYAMDHPEEIARLIHEKYAPNRSVESLTAEAQGMRRMVVRRSAEIGHMNPVRWRHIRDEFAKLGMLPGNYPLEGFLYDPEQSPVYTWPKWLKWLAATVTIGLLGTILVAISLWAFNRKLDSAVKERTAHLKRVNAEMEIEARQRKAAETELRAEHWRLQNIIEGTGVGTWEWNIQSGETLYNEQWAKMIGYTLEELAPISIKTWQSLCHPDDLKESTRAHERHFAGELAFYDCECRLKHKNGHWIWVHDRGCVVTRAPDGKPLKMFGTHTDITARKTHESEMLRLSRLYLALSQVNELITRVKTRDELLIGVCQVAVERGGLKMAWIGWLDRQTQVVVPAAVFGDRGGYLNEIKIYADDRPEGQGPTGTAIREGQTIVCNDFMLADETLPWHEAAKRQGFGSSAVFPIHEEGRVCGALTVYAGEPQCFSEQEILLFEKAALNVSFALDHLEQEERRRHLEATLRWKTEELDRYFTSALDLLCIADTKGIFRRLNPQWQQALGYLLSEMEGSQLLDWVHPEDKDATQRIIAKLTDQELVTDFTNRLRHKNGSYRSLEWRCFSRGKMIYAVARDMTEQHQAVAALMASEERFRQMAENIESVFWVSNAEISQMIYVSPAYEKIWGRTCESPYQQPRSFLEAVHPEDRERVISAMRSEHADAQGQFRLEYRIHRPDGSVRWIRDRGFPIRNQAGQLVRIVGIADDISEHKLASDTLRESEQYHRTVLETAMDGFWRLDLQGRLRDVNEAYCRMSGYDKESLLAMHVSGLESTETAADTAAHIQRVVTAGQDRFESKHRRKDGSTFDVEASAQYRPEGSGEIIAFVRDITQRKVLEAQLFQAQKLESIGRLAGGVAHDFNNILAAIMLQLGFLQQHPSLDLELQESLSELMNESQRAADLTRQLLMFGRQSVLQFKTLDLNETVANVLKMLMRLIGEHISLRFSRTAGLPPVKADPGMVEQVLMNLCLNSRDSMPRGGRVTISLEAVQADESRTRPYAGVQPGPFACVSVSDTGCGMDEATRQRVFEPFFTTKEVGKGTGLGLATVYGIVGQHKGWIEVDSKLGQGTTFRVFLPATRPEEVEPARTLKPMAIGGYERILLAEDEPAVRQITARGLRRMGYEVLEAASGEEALKLWEQQHLAVDLVLTDMVMSGGMTGLDLAAKLREISPSLKVIISSGYSAEMVAGSNSTGINYVRLDKPYRLETLSKVVRDCLDEG